MSSTVPASVFVVQLPATLGFFLRNHFPAVLPNDTSSFDSDCGKQAPTVQRRLAHAEKLRNRKGKQANTRAWSGNVVQSSVQLRVPGAAAWDFRCVQPTNPQIHFGNEFLGMSASHNWWDFARTSGLVNHGTVLLPRLRKDPHKFRLHRVKQQKRNKIQTKQTNNKQSKRTV